MRVLIPPVMVVYMLMIGFTASQLGIGNAVFQDDSCFNNPPCSAFVDGGDGFFGAILGFFKTLFNFFSIFWQLMFFQLDINFYANLFIVGFISMICFTTAYVMLRQG